ncbi:hypothetical protein H4219_001072 [Mycoemilia scoparia]|uniref:Nuclear movement protein nudC n=1 Tax=Mycoemilia scoparia TaxID=417184 RepID=A0A9W8DSB2_9FUNG|nr:hypothetical protein H4219_001072 [Mycoemilia scoparia]
MNAPDRFEMFVLPEGVKKISMTKDTKLPNCMVFDIQKEDHTIGNTLRYKLLENPKVLYAAYKVPHPLEYHTLVKVQTTPDTTPLAALQSAIQQLIIEYGNIRTKFEMELVRVRPTAGSAAAGAGSSQYDQSGADATGGYGMSQGSSVGANIDSADTLEDVTVTIDLEENTSARDISVVFGKNSIKAGLKGQKPIIDGLLSQAIDVEESTWSIADKKQLEIHLEKANKQKWWDCVIKGDPKIDTTKLVPDNSRLSDLDSEARAAVEKMMYDQRQKLAGNPTSDEQKRQEVFRKFQEQHPEMDFSNAKFGGFLNQSS